MTNQSNKFFKNPITLPGFGSSDHLCVLYEPQEKINSQIEKNKITIRTFPDSGIKAFGTWLIHFDWSALLKINDVNMKVNYFFQIMWAMIDKYFPLKIVVSTNNDKPWITSKIKTLITERQKAHKNKNFHTRDQLARKIKLEIKKAKHKYNDSKIKGFSNPNIKELYQHINNIINNGQRKSEDFL